MRLYLSSYRIGAHPERLLELAGAGRRAALVPNALDGAPSADLAAGLGRDRRDLVALGLQVAVVDMRDSDATTRLAAADVIWVRGGNVFALRKALAERHLDRVLTELIRGNRVAYGGYSAGAAVLAGDLSELSAVDDPGTVTDPIMSGLEILDRPFVPHVQSPGHPESRACDAVSAAYASRGQSHWALRDGDVLLVDGETTTVLRPAPGSAPEGGWSSWEG